MEHLLIRLWANGRPPTEHSSRNTYRYNRTQCDRRKRIFTVVLVGVKIPRRIVVSTIVPATWN